eukprot:maker-scaffold_57-snap-gene-0.0-mRNA-1 protein AED:0.32 eAED:0.34 QI:0/0/0/1/0/0/2/0/300
MKREIVLNELKRQYEVKNTLDIDSYVGFEIEQNEKYIFLTATGYIEKIAKSFEVLEDQNIQTPHIVNQYIDQEMESKQLELKRKYQSLVRFLAYINMVFRPDVSFQTNMLVQKISKPLVSHLNARKKCIKYLLNTKFLGLKYPKTAEKYEVEAFSDASYATLVERHSVSGYIVKINKTVTLFKTKKQKLVSTSSTETEILGCSLMIKELKWVKINLEFLNIKLSKVTLFTDKKVLQASFLSKNTYPTSSNRKFNIFCKKILENKKWTLRYIKRKKNETDTCSSQLTETGFYPPESCGWRI